MRTRTRRALFHSIMLTCRSEIARICARFPREAQTEVGRGASVAVLSAKALPQKL